MKKGKIFLWVLLLIIVVPLILNPIKAFVFKKIKIMYMSKPPIVETTVVRESTDFDKIESAGRLSSVYEVEIVARINGWLEKSYFKEGADVQAGQLLFLIEPDEYQIAVENARAAVRQTTAALNNSQKELKRAEELVKNDFVSKSYYDKALALRDENKAMLDVNRAKLNSALLNLSYTKIKAPVSGKIGKILITQGNLVNAQSGAIATIYSTNPIYANFTLNSDQYLKFRKDNQSKPDLSNMKVQIKLADGSIYPIEGKVQFVDNAVDTSAGTIALRATFDNPDKLLVPNDYINVIASSVNPRTVVLAPQSAVLDSQEGYYVLMIDKDGNAYKKLVKVSDQKGKDWVVTDGLKKGDVIISKGLLSVKEGKPVVVKEPQKKEVKKDGILQKFKNKFSKKKDKK